MEAKELRVGNLVFFPLKDIPALILRDMFEYQNGLANLEDYRPIPLAKEWLLRLGFTQSYEHDYYELNDFILDNEFILCDIDIRVQTLYVHQLQNLYFALTGLELEYEQN